MKTPSELFWEQTERMRQVAKERARGPEFFKPYWETKKGNWELIYPDFDDIKGWSCYLTVKCLDCGHEFLCKAGCWLVINNDCGCANCNRTKSVERNAKLFESKGFDVLDASTTDKRSGSRIYRFKCRKCGEEFQKKGNNFNNWLAHGTKCPICLGKSFPPDIMKIRKLHNKFGITYKQLSERAHYSYEFVMNVVRGAEGTDETIKSLADVAEEMAKEKEHGNSRIGQFN